jgi:hypothetical protein
VTLLPEIGEVEAAGASADDGDTHGLLPQIGSILLIGSVEHFLGHRKDGLDPSRWSMMNLG